MLKLRLEFAFLKISCFYPRCIVTVSLSLGSEADLGGHDVACSLPVYQNLAAVQLLGLLVKVLLHRVYMLAYKD